MVDVTDSKSVAGNSVRVRVPPPALKKLVLLNKLFSDNDR